ncbi:MAG TPA: aldehyde dehydrogenase family protein, partial [Candidatus Baltobacteraceae bacterium]|nr:aldehyde dehydrogenase family protein [Candidatus Baltobacteraceae bacterium]
MTMQTAERKGMADVVTLNPATGAEIERFTYMSGPEIDAHLDAARAAFARWRREPFETRSALLHALAATLRRDSAALAQAAVREMGKPIVQARAEVEK